MELTYDGVDQDGIHVWRSLTPISRTDKVTFGLFPARTTVCFPSEQD